MTLPLQAMEAVRPEVVPATSQQSPMHMTAASCGVLFLSEQHIMSRRTLACEYDDQPAAARTVPRLTSRR